MYDQIAQFYDLIHQELKEDIRFTLQLVKDNGSNILELGCGTGRVMLPFARAGHNVVGLDNSPAMIQVALSKIASESERVQNRINILETDISSFALNKVFDLILIPHNNLMHLNQKQVGDCFHCISNHLQATGQLFIDVDNPLMMANPDDDLILIMEQILPDAARGVDIMQMSSSWVDADRQVRHTTWIFDSTPTTGGAVDRITVTNQLHYLFAHQMEISLQDNGLKVEHMFGDYDHSIYTEQSPRLIILAKRKLV